MKFLVFAAAFLLVVLLASVQADEYRPVTIPHYQLKSSFGLTHVLEKRKDIHRQEKKG